MYGDSFKIKTRGTNYSFKQTEADVLVMTSEGFSELIPNVEFLQQEVMNLWKKIDQVDSCKIIQGRLKQFNGKLLQIQLKRPILDSWIIKHLFELRSYSASIQFSTNSQQSMTSSDEDSSLENIEKIDDSMVLDEIMENEASMIKDHSVKINMPHSEMPCDNREVNSVEEKTNERKSVNMNFNEFWFNTNMGRLVEVYWEGDNKWYRGQVSEFDQNTGKVLITYDDGENHYEDIKLLRTRFPFPETELRTEKKSRVSLKIESINSEEHYSNKRKGPMLRNRRRRKRQRKG